MANKGTRPEEENAYRARYDAAMALVVEYLESLRHRRGHGRVEIHVARGVPEFVRYGEDNKL